MESASLSRTALVTGVTGFVGSHLAESLLSDGVNVVGVARGTQWAVGAEHLEGRVPVEDVELSDVNRLREVFAAAKPDEVYHLAGLASVPVSIRQPNIAWEVNFLGSQNVYAALEAAAPSARMLVISTGTVYGKPTAELGAITERTPFHPTTPYSQSKLAADLLGLRLAQERGLKIFVVRSFNHIGPRQQGEFAIADFAKQIAKGEKDASPQLHCGNIDIDRDFLDVRDVVKAYRALMQHAQPGEPYNLASGKTYRLRTLVEKLLSSTGAKFEIVQDASRLRSDDPDVIRVDPAKLQKQTGWKPTIPIETTLKDVLEYCRSVR
jgi:GDP-4-dehydro-6-deoxy-D-mannose reductase